VRVNFVARRPGLAIPARELDVFTVPGFVPTSDAVGESPRFIGLLSDKLMRPGFNLIAVLPLSRPVGALDREAFGMAAGTPAMDVVHTLQTRAAAMPLVRDGTEG
jgi:hypothetical protein